MTTNVAATGYRERLIPGFALFVMLLLILPAVALVVTPISAASAIPIAVIAYLLVTAALFLTSPKVAVTGTQLLADRAEIDVAQLGEIELLGSDALRAALGPALDARSFLVVRGWIHSGVKIENVDPADPAPYWIITTRRPQALADAIRAAQ